jgi:hypothetical protein
MAKFSRKDQQLLTEAYGVQLLTESLPGMSLAQLIQKLEHPLTLQESVYVETVSNRVIEELFGGLRALAGAGSGAAKSAGGGIAQGLKNAAGAAGSAIKGAAQGVGAAAKQVGQNVGDIYNSAEEKSKADQALKQANAAAQQLVQLVQSAQQKQLVTFSGDPMQLPLEELIDELILAQQGAGNMQRSAQKKGVFGSAGQAFKQGFRA